MPPPTQLHLWLQDHAGAIVTYPPTLSAANVILALLAQPGMAGQPALVMSADPSVYGTSLPVELFIPYNASTLLTTALENEALIFIDNLTTLYHFRTLDLVAVPHRAKLILLTTWGVTSGDIAAVQTALPGLVPLVVAFLEERVQLVFTLAPTLMTPEQDLEYSRRRTLEEQLALTGTKAEVREATQKLKTLQIGNFLYPPERQITLNIPRASRPPLLPDAAWFHPAVAQHLSAYSPKFHQLLNRLQAQHEDRHVLHTRFKDHFGAFLLQALLQYYQFTPLLVTGDDKAPEREAKYQQFNQRQHNLLITTVLPSGPLLNVDHLHFIEGYDWDTLQAFLGAIYQHRNYEGEGRLEVVSHLAQRSDNTEATDGVYNGVIASYLRERNQIYGELLTVGYPLVFGPAGIMVVSPQE